MKHPNWIVTLVALFGAASCTTETTPPATGTDGTALSGFTAHKSELASFKIDGMTCGVACPPKVRAALVKGLGLKSEQVGIDYRTKLITLDLGGKELDEAAVTEAFQGTGYSIGH